MVLRAFVDNFHLSVAPVQSFLQRGNLVGTRTRITHLSWWRSLQLSYEAAVRVPLSPDSLSRSGLTSFGGARVAKRKIKSQVRVIPFITAVVHNPNNSQFDQNKKPRLKARL